ncbi:MAG TPA: hypothetical protein PK833_11670, partial [Vicingus sp.]|nr:hypothetical protein [Vicingus sp.]
MVTTIVPPTLDAGGTITYAPAPQGMVYKYDRLNRLKSSKAWQDVDAVGNLWATGDGSSYAGMYENNFIYDANGNITTQVRKDHLGVIIDDLTYKYAVNSNGRKVQNRLYHVNDPYNYNTEDIDDMGIFNDDIATINDGITNNYKYDEIGNLTKDNQEEIEEIKWRVDGKIAEIKRGSGSNKQNLVFNYDASGNRIAKHLYLYDTNNEYMWEKSTYYVRDAQGNPMAVYNLTASGSSGLSYKVAERNIYGSNRLGNNNGRVEMIAAPPIDTSKYMHYVGNRQYELSNHLGNVMSVISDRKIARDINQDNTVDYYEPDVILTYDYSPFGAPLHARSFSKEVCHDTTFTMVVEDLNTNFDDGTTQGWSIIGSAALSVSSGQLKIVKNGGGPVSLGMGATNSFVATSGNVYNFTITIDKGSCNPSSNILLQLLDANNTVIYTQTLTSGSQTYSTQFTANTSGAYTIRVTRINNASKC